LKRHQEDDNLIIVQSNQHQQTTDCEASCEYTSEESGHESDTSEEITDSVATCLQGAGDHLLLTSTEGLGSSSTEVKMRAKHATSLVGGRRHSERPWSVSCLSQLTHNNSRQSLTDTKVVEKSLANFSISESALNEPLKYKNTSESDSKKSHSTKNATSTSVGSKNSLRRKRAKLRKKSHSLKSGEAELLSSDVSRSILRTMTKSESFSLGTSLMEDLSDAISMMTIVKDNQQHSSSSNSQQSSLHQQSQHNQYHSHVNGHHQNSSLNSSSSPQKPESDDEQQQRMMKPDFKIGSFTNVYANQTNLGSLAALANYNNDQDMNETGTENMSSFSENMWDNYMGEKYNSEAYSEDRDVDGARRLLDFGDDYRAFIDSQSDNCSSLSAANIDSLSPPRPRKFNNNNALAQQQNLSLSSNDNSMKILKQKRIQELPETERRRISKDEGNSHKSLFYLSF
jgi:hypothetical protein